MGSDNLAMAGAVMGAAALAVSVVALRRASAVQLAGRRVVSGATAKPVYNLAQAYRDTVYVSGQVGLKDGALVAGGVEAETRQVLSNLKDALEKSGSGMEHVLKTNCYLADIGDYGKFNEVYSSVFSDPATMPARVCFAVNALPLGAKVEVDAIATPRPNAKL